MVGIPSAASARRWRYIAAAKEKGLIRCLNERPARGSVRQRPQRAVGSAAVLRRPADRAPTLGIVLWPNRRGGARRARPSRAWPRPDIQAPVIDSTMSTGRLDRAVVGHRAGSISRRKPRHRAALPQNCPQASVPARHSAGPAAVQAAQEPRRRVGGKAAPRGAWPTRPCGWRTRRCAPGAGQRGARRADRRQRGPRGTGRPVSLARREARHLSAGDVVTVLDAAPANRATTGRCSRSSRPPGYAAVRRWRCAGIHVDLAAGVAEGESRQSQTSSTGSWKSPNPSRGARDGPSRCRRPCGGTA